MPMESGPPRPRPATPARPKEQEDARLAACEAALEALEMFTLCDIAEGGLDEEGGTKFGYVHAEVVQERVVTQLKAAIGPECGTGDRLVTTKE